LVTGSEVTPGYFRLLGMTLVRGRVFEDFDTDRTPPVIVIDEAMARTYWPHQDPIGRRVKLSPRDTSWSTIVGIVADARTESLTSAAEPHVYASLYQRQGKHLAMFVQGGSAPAELEAHLRDVVQSLDSSLPVFGAETLNDTVAASLAMRRLSLELIGLFAVVALVLSMIGIYGVIAYAVSERTQEIGVRLALGADPSRIMHMLMHQGLGMAIGGATFGFAGAMIVSRVLARTLEGVRPVDPLTLIGSAVVLTAVAAIGCYLPARRVVRIEPVIALRS
jgi:predicted permease